MESERIYSSQVKRVGICSFPDLYQFCYDWLIDETNLLVSEDKYSEKIKGDAKEIDVKWTGIRKFSDYFKSKITVEFKTIALKKVEIVQNGAKIKSNEGEIKITLKADLIRDWQGTYDTNWWAKFWRSVYDRWIIPHRIDQMEDKIIGDSEEFLSQAKAFMDIEARN